MLELIHRTMSWLMLELVHWYEEYDDQPEIGVNLDMTH